jgi:hypothetical protein
MEVNEYKGKDREMFNRGMEHVIFASETNPNILFKIGDLDVIQEWYEVFKSNPEVFPKVYRMGKVPSEEKYYVVIEKLNASKFEKEWDKLELALEDVGAVDPDKGENFTTVYIIDGTSSEKFIEIGVLLKNHNKSAYNFYIKLLDVIKKCEQSQLEVLGKDTLVDAHKYNFGYSKDGKIKCLDL